MKNYIKPNMDLSKIELNQNIASGLAQWLETDDGKAYNGVGISEYDLYAVSSN